MACSANLEKAPGIGGTTLVRAAGGWALRSDRRQEVFDRLWHMAMWSVQDAVGAMGCANVTKMFKVLNLTPHHTPPGQSVGSGGGRLLW